jgi:1,4-alpha-glucan branching enzyme
MSQTKTALSPGLGAIPHHQGCSFRIWAPHAEAIYVTGTFNNWAEHKTPMSLEGDGYWSVDVPDAKIGDEYRYILVHKEQKLSRIDPWAREVTNSTGNAVIHDTNFDWENDAAFPIPSLNELVIYEMHIGTFARQTQDSPGTFAGAIQKLPYLKTLGINAIELLPIAEFAGGISWGYNPGHPFAVESDYGGPKSFKEFVKAAHAHGIAVIVDVVYNHFGPSDLDLWQFDGWHENEHGGIFFYNDNRAKTPWGDTRPDYGRAEVRQYLRDNAMMWIDEYHVDGLRFDSVVNIRNVHGNNNDPANDLPDGWSLLQWITSEVKAHKPMAFTIAEDLQGNEFLTKKIDQQGAGFDAQWEPQFLYAVRDAIAAFDDADRDLERIKNSLLFNFNGDIFQRVIYTESHDDVAEGDVRIPEKWYCQNICRPTTSAIKSGWRQ